MTLKRINRGRGHSYLIDGKKADGVTTVLGAGWPQPWMGPWQAKTVAQAAVDMDEDEWVALLSSGRDKAVTYLKGAANRQRDTAAARGTDVHNLAEKLVAGDELEVPDAIFGHVQAVARFLDEWKIRQLLVEKTVGSYKYGYAGTFDLVAEIFDGRRVLFDYKTSSSIKETTALQLAAYRHADVYLTDDCEMPLSEVGITECKAVHVRGDGYDVYPLDTSEPVFKAFLATLSVARYHQMSSDWVGAPELAVAA